MSSFNLTALDKIDIVGSVSLDLKKAFDLVDHDILIYKLRLHRLTDIISKWSTSYHENNTQVVKVRDNVSAKQTITRNSLEARNAPQMPFVHKRQNLRSNTTCTPRYGKENNLL